MPSRSSGPAGSTPIALPKRRKGGIAGAIGDKLSWTRLPNLNCYLGSEDSGFVRAGVVVSIVGRMPRDLGAVWLNAARAAGPPLAFGLRLWASVCLALFIAFWLELDNAYWAGTSAAVMCQPQLGASLRKGWFRMVGTLIGATAVVVLTAWFPQSRVGFLGGLTLWCAMAAAGATLLRNFSSYAAGLAGFTAAIVAADTLGATGGADTTVFLLAVTRAAEICIGIVSAGVVLAGTDLGGAQRRLAKLMVEPVADIMARFNDTLVRARPGPSEYEDVDRNLTRVVALDPVIDQAIGEDSELRVQSSVLARAVDGLMTALASWSSVAVRLGRLNAAVAGQEASVVLRYIPPEMQRGDLTPRGADPLRLQQTAQGAARALLAAPVATPSLRLMADQTASVMAGLADAFGGLALLAGAQLPYTVPRGGALHVPDWLPALLNAARTFVAIGGVSLFWIVTAWPTGGAAMAFAAIVVVLLAPQAELAFTVASLFMVGTVIGMMLAAVIDFAILPGHDNFLFFCAALGLYLIPVGMLRVSNWLPPIFIAMTVLFIPLLAPSNPQTYDTEQFYNSALAIVLGAGVATMAFRLVPALSPEYRVQRLLELTRRDLRSLASREAPQNSADWEGLTHARLATLPPQATPAQRRDLLAALLVGTEIIRLRRLAPGPDFADALAALSRGDSADATTRLAQIDRRLALRSDGDPVSLRARASILAITEALSRHTAYFDEGGRR